ncbi:hypothetical protein Acr_00g0073660 [Actinidia rufa]|uniref:Uncharacterized protein n=1 Tax=Actinidia rufa TaxID=165716 RepID=A0A7J0DSJ3_9ERIC|nr:hypothetical protein Acr_00g0073660 [Actinidia rufa]
MDTRGKSNTEFRSEVSEVLARHESSFDQIHATLQTILTDLQALKAQTNISTIGDVNPLRSVTPPKPPNPTLNLAPPILPLNSISLNSPAKTPPDGFTELNNTLNFKVLSLLNESSLLRSTSKELPSNGTVEPVRSSYPSQAHHTTVSAYQEEFEKLSQLIDALPDNHLIGIFIAGLKDEVRLDVKLTNPHTLSEAIGIARLVEERNSLQKKPTASLLGPPPHLKNIPVAEISPPPFKRSTDQEARIRQEKGLCFYCDEKYRPGHRCNKPQLFMIEDSLFLEPHAESYTEPPPPEPDPNPNPIKPLISPNRSQKYPTMP